jgi:aminoglycoside 3-N-acetyltransferase
LSAWYTTASLVAAYEALGLRRGDTAYVSGNLGALGFHQSRSKTAVLASHLEALQTVLGSGGTVVVPTHSHSLCNTSTVFDAATTPSERGAFTEWVRTQPGAVRQFHPFASLTALEPAAAHICGGCTRHGYGPNTPYDRLIPMGAWAVSIGMAPRLTCNVIHHMEQLMAVPYRYTKEFLHPVRRDGEVRVEPFYLYVTYLESDLVRDKNRKLFADPELADACKEARVGMGVVSAYPLRALASAATRLMTADIYHWLERPPETRPFQI